MKNKYVAIMLGLVLAISPAAVYASETETESLEASTGDAETDMSEDTLEDVSQELILGEVASIEEDSITVKLGTRQEPPADGTEVQGETSATEDGTDEETEESETGTEETSGDEETEESTETEAFNAGEPGAMLELTGEEQTIPITEDTIVLKISMEKPDSGETISEDTASDSQNETAETLEASDSEADTSAESETAAETETSGSEAAETISEANSGIPGEDMEPESETASLEDISEGDVVEIELDDSGNAAVITIQSMD